MPYLPHLAAPETAGSPAKNSKTRFRNQSGAAADAQIMELAGRAYSKVDSRIFTRMT